MEVPVTEPFDRVRFVLTGGAAASTCSARVVGRTLEVAVHMPTAAAPCPACGSSTPGREPPGVYLYEVPAEEMTGETAVANPAADEPHAVNFREFL